MAQGSTPDTVLRECLRSGLGAEALRLVVAHVDLRLPHRIVTGAEREPPEEPVLIGRADEPPATRRWDLLINLCDEVPEFFSRFARVAEVVDADPERRARGRERYRYYRDRGYALNTHEV